VLTKSFLPPSWALITENIEPYSKVRLPGLAESQHGLAVITIKCKAKNSLSSLFFAGFELVKRKNSSKPSAKAGTVFSTVITINDVRLRAYFSLLFFAGFEVVKPKTNSKPSAKADTVFPAVITINDVNV